MPHRAIPLRIPQPDLAPVQKCYQKQLLYPCRGRLLDDESGVVLLMVPAKSFIAFYAEPSYAIGDLPYHLSTTLRVVGK